MLTNTLEFKNEIVAMNHNDYISQELSGEDALKLILCGSIENTKDATFGVVSVDFATNNKETAQQKFN